MRAPRGTLNRRSAALALASAAFSLQLRATTDGPAPALLRIRAATLSVPSIAAIETLYCDWLDQVVRERGVVDHDLARSWGAPAAAGRSYLLMSPDSAPDVFLRVIESPQSIAPPPFTTYGWSAIEIVVDDPDRLRETLRRSPFRIVGEPAPLPTIPSIRAFQMVGTAGEVLYLASETGDRSKSVLPLPNGRVGRIFIMVSAASRPQVTLDWYARSFALSPGSLRKRSNPLLNLAQGLPADTPLPIATARLARHGNLIQVDGYAATASPREVHRGDLPPVVAMTTFTVDSIEALGLDRVRAPAAGRGLLYGGARTATVRGPDGELIELVEEKPAS